MCADARRGSVTAWRRVVALLLPVALACEPREADAPDRAAPGSAPAAAPAAPAAVTPGAAIVEALTVPTYGKVLPVDEGPNDPAFAAFRDSVLRIVAARDTSALLALVAPDIKNSFGGDGGPAEFRAQWRLGEPDSELWGVLDDILRHGGRFAGPDAFIAPYTFDGLPDTLDAFEHLMVRDADVPVHAGRDSTSAILARLSYDIVRAGPYDPETTWTAIALGGERVGYVPADRIRSAVDYRLQFARRDGRWLLVFLLAGD